MSKVCCFCDADSLGSSYLQILDMTTTTFINNSTINVQGINLQSGSVELEESGVIKFNTSGAYYISWWMNFIEDNVVISLLKSSDNEVLASSTSPDRRIALKGNTILRVDSEERIMFVNDSGGMRNIRTNIPGISINMVIIQL